MLTRSRSFVALMLAAAAVLPACSDGGGTEDPIDPRDLTVDIVSGDQFEDTVHIPAPSGAIGAYEPVAVGELEVSPEPLVAVFGDGGGSPSAAIAPTGPSPSFVVLPENTTADWVIVDAEGTPITDGSCGRPVNVTTIPDENGEVTNYWERPLKSGTCYMRLQGVVGDSAYVDTVFVRTFLPGPPAVPPGFPAYGIPWGDCQSTTNPTGAEAALDGFADANGNATQQWRVEAVGAWIETVSTTFGTPESRRVRIVGSPVVGDTATALIYDASGTALSEMAVTFTATRCTDMSTSPPVYHDTWRLDLRDKRQP